MSKFKKIFDRYKTYDDSQGRGNVEQWKSSFDERMSNDEAHKIVKDSDPLSILGLSKIPDLEELKVVYRHLIMKNHPDRGGDHMRCKQIIAAYTVILKRISRL